MQYLRLKNWERFQHYGKRNPPWIKLYNSLLDNYDFSVLPDQTKFHVVASMLLASRTGNRIPKDMKWLASKIGATSEVSLEGLLSSGMFEEFQDDSQPCKQDASKMLDSVEKSRDRDRGETPLTPLAGGTSIELEKPRRKNGKPSWTRTGDDLAAKYRSGVDRE